MKKIIIATTSIGILMFVVLIFAFGEKNDQTLSQHASSSENINEFSDQDDKSKLSENNNYQTQTDSQANVTVEVVPKQLGKEELKNIFSVSMSTHSVELDFDVTQITDLKDDLSNTYRALEWTGGRGGHHISGDIVFPKVDERAKSVELEISAINGVNRTFQWTLED